MRIARARSLLWFVGPALGILLVSAAFVLRVGPGLLTLALCGVVVFAIIVPLLQFVLLSTRRFSGRHAAACVVALVIGVFVLWVPTALGFFSFW